MTWTHVYDHGSSDLAISMKMAYRDHGSSDLAAGIPAFLTIISGEMQSPIKMALGCGKRGGATERSLEQKLATDT